MRLEVTAYAFWLNCGIKDIKVYHRLKFAGSQEKLRAVKPSRGHPGNIGETHDWASLSLKVFIASRVGCASFVASETSTSY